MTPSITRKILFRWTGWFALANSLVFGVVSLRYFGGSVPADTALAWLYLVTVYIGHHVMLSVAPLFLLATPLILIYPSRRALTALAVTLFAAMIALTMLDSLLWSESRFHLNALTARILGWQSWVFAGLIFVIALVFESLLARAVWNWAERRARAHGRLLGALCGLAIVVSQTLHAWADAAYYVPVTSLGQYLPVYKGVTAKSFFMDSGLVDVEASRERELARRLAQGAESAGGRLLDYPQQPLQCTGGAGMNLLLIVIDALRGSVVTPELTPRLVRYTAERGADFRNHFSGGNSSRIGMFSLFYGLPPGYWDSFSSLQQPTVLMDGLQARAYQLGIFTSATMVRPVVLDRTAFASVPELRTATRPESDPSWKRDRTMTGEWFDWLEARDPKRPFFGFLFFDAATARNLPPELSPPIEPADDSERALAFAQYQSAVHYVDGLVGEVLDDLEARGLADDTVVMITADHGEEFGESGVKMDKHGSGYTRYQLITPMIVAWPGRGRGTVYQHRTSHYDIVPTLMTDFLGCSNVPSDYSVGGNLYDGESWDFIVAGSYYNYAVLEPDQVTITFPNGLLEVRDWDYHLLSQPEFRGKVLEAVSEQNVRFYSD